MQFQQIEFSKVLNDDQVYDKVMANYDQLGKDWINHQWRWMNTVYQAFKDHYKYMIIISLVEKTLQFYDQMNIKLTYDQFYSKSYLQIDKFSITELCEKLELPKETVMSSSKKLKYLPMKIFFDTIFNSRYKLDNINLGGEAKINKNLEFIWGTSTNKISQNTRQSFWKSFFAASGIGLAYSINSIKIFYSSFFLGTGTLYNGVAFEINVI